MPANSFLSLLLLLCPLFFFFFFCLHLRDQPCQAFLLHWAAIAASRATLSSGVCSVPQKLLRAESLSEFTQCTPSSCIYICSLSALSGLFLFLCVAPSDVLSMMPSHLGSPALGVFIKLARVGRALLALPGLGR